MTNMPVDAPGTCPLGLNADDLQRCHDVLGLDSWQALAGQSLLLTGGTGFVGKWLLATLLDAERRLSLGCSITVVSRNPQNFISEWPALQQRIAVVAGDVRSLDLAGGKFDVVVHAATDVAAASSPEEIFSTCVDGTRQILKAARKAGAHKLLLVSSGAIYGPQPIGMTHVPETYLGGPDPLSTSSAYAEGKRAAEWLACNAANAGLHVSIARVFALVGPYLPLDRHFAIGNFIKAALDGTDIVIQGDGTPHRSYLYAADMAAWLWAVLLRGNSGRAYNVGAEESISISELARRVAKQINSDVKVRTLKSASPSQQIQHYVPDTRRVRSELSLNDSLSLDQALLRTAKWYRARPNGPQCAGTNKSTSPLI